MKNITRAELLENFVKIKHSELHASYRDHIDSIESDKNISEGTRRTSLVEVLLQRDREVADIDEAVKYMSTADRTGLRDEVTRMEFAKEKSPRVIMYMRIILDIMEHYDD